jgi:hypothetical protein
MYCHWRSSYQEGKVGIPLTDLTPPQFCANSKTKTWISNGMVSELRWEGIVRSGDIGGIDGHHCLIFLFIKQIR